MGQPQGTAPTPCSPFAGTDAPSAVTATTDTEEMIFSGVDMLKLSTGKSECPNVQSPGDCRGGCEGEGFGEVFEHFH